MTTAPARPNRDRPTWICYLQNGFFAWFIYAFGATQALLRDEQGTTRSIAALHGTFLALGSLVGSLLAGPAMLRWGRGLVMRVGGIGAIIGILVYTTPHGAFPVTLAGASMAALSGSFFVSALNAFVMDHQGEAGPSALLEANAFAAFLGILAPLAVGVATASAFGWRAGVWVTVAALVAVELLRGRDLSAFRTDASELAHELHDKMPKKIYWSLGLFMCFVATEFSMTFWSADLLRERCGFSAGAAASSIGAITGGMLVGRLIGARLAERLSADFLLRASVVLSLLAFVLAWAFTWWPAVILGLALGGIGISVQTPLGIARVMQVSNGLTDRASALALVAASIAVATAPIALGVIADHVGVHLAFLMVPVFLAIALTILLVRPVAAQEHTELQSV
ncbi:unannotated protein [freshwater metagenome]|uniref:Unannotated protein n=1 Tax=freshwater metagenome TaxID=449393 RepID=A0A6J7S7S8_9ZZZZ